MNILLKTALAATLLASGAAQATTINFSSFAYGAVPGPISGATFTLFEGISRADPLAVDQGVGMALTNIDWSYTPYSQLFVRFAAPVSNISFRLDTYSVDATAASVGAYNHDGDRLTRVSVGADSIFNPVPGGFANLITINASDVAYLKFSNGGDNTAFGISQLNFTSAGGVGGVPEPASWAMMIAGFGLIGASARRRRGTGVLA